MTQDERVVLCREEGCDRRAVVRGFCRSCYGRWYLQNRDRLPPSPRTKPIRSHIREASCRYFGCTSMEYRNYLCEEHHRLIFGKDAYTSWQRG